MFDEINDIGLEKKYLLTNNKNNVLQDEKEDNNIFRFVHNNNSINNDGVLNHTTYTNCLDGDHTYYAIDKLMDQIVQDIAKEEYDKRRNILDGILNFKTIKSEKKIISKIQLSSPTIIISARNECQYRSN